jgi:hypothetical protein
MSRPRLWFLAVLAFLAAATRVAPHPWNFTPLTAITLFGASTFPRRWMGAAVAVAALLFSDMLLQLTYWAGLQPNWGFYRGQWVIYACLVPTLGFGFALRNRRHFATIAAATLASSVTFFLATNFTVWAYGSGVTYPKTLAGLLLCYEAAVPFFQNSLAGDVCFATVLFGGLALADYWLPAWAEKRSSLTAVAVLSEPIDR